MTNKKVDTRVEEKKAISFEREVEITLFKYRGRLFSEAEVVKILVDVHNLKLVKLLKDQEERMNKKITFKGLTEDNRVMYGGFSVHATGKIIQTKDEIALAGKIVKVLLNTKNK